MDPLTHALLGACAAQAALASPKRDIVGRYPRRHVAMVGALAGLLPDLDVLIRSSGDPLLAIEYHRHFTHALAFIPVGGLLAILPWLLLKSQRPRWGLLWLAGMLGYATHGVLDACTNYGTHLLWPFSNTRTAWHWITTVGPVLTLLLALGLGFAVRRRTRTPAVMALLCALCYVGVAAWQQERAFDVQNQIAAQRGHTVARGEIFPTVGNPFVWRSLYESNGQLYTDRIRLVGTPQWQAGHAVALLNAEALPANERVRSDFARFHYFSAGWVARAVDDESFIGDARYSLSTESFEPIWGVRFHPHLPQPTEWVDRTAQNRIPISRLWAEINGTATGYVSLN